MVSPPTRLASPLVAAALCALAACQVSTEGAPCHGDVSCPSGQRCGADQRCSVKAAGCTECADGETACVPGLATCAVAADGICRSFGAPVAPGPHQVCDSSTPRAARILCPPAGSTFYVDPGAGADASATPAPTGASAPAICRFNGIRPAIDAANAVVQATAGATATVLVSATGGTVPLTLTEALPVELQPGVTLTSDAAASPTGPPASLPYAVELTGTLTLHEGATLSGLEVRPGANFPAVGDGIVTACAAGATAPAVVQDARVVGTNAGARFTNSVHQAGACPLTVARTLVEGGGKGIFVEATSTAVMRIDAGEVCGARDVGLYFFQVPSTVQVHVTNTTVHGNCATMDTPVLGGTRRAGGVVFEGALPSTDFRGNKVLDNQGDQVLVASTGAAPGFTLTGDSTASGNVCPAPQDANHFTCRDTTGAHVVVFSSGAAVSALGNFWFNVPPNLGEDYSANVDPKGTGAQLCGITDRACAGTPTSCP